MKKNIKSIGKLIILRKKMVLKIRPAKMRLFLAHSKNETGQTYRFRERKRKMENKIGIFFFVSKNIYH